MGNWVEKQTRIWSAPTLEFAAARAMAFETAEVRVPNLNVATLRSACPPTYLAQLDLALGGWDTIPHATELGGLLLFTATEGLVLFRPEETRQTTLGGIRVPWDSIDLARKLNLLFATGTLESRCRATLRLANLPLPANIQQIEKNEGPLAL